MSGWSEVQSGVHARLLAVLEDLPAIGKNQKNTQQGFMFRGHDDILNALNPLLATHGVFVVPDVIERVPSQRTTSKGNVMYEVNLHVRFRFYGADGDFIEASTWGEGTDTGDKATNKAMTMAFKNVLNQTFAISSAEFKDPDADTPEETSQDGRKEAQEPFSAPASVKAGKEPASERAASAGTIKILRETVAALDKGFPLPDPNRMWWDEVEAWVYETFGKTPQDEKTELEAQQTVLEFERRLVRAQEETKVPFS